MRIIMGRLKETRIADTRRSGRQTRNGKKKNTGCPPVKRKLAALGQGQHRR